MSGHSHWAGIKHKKGVNDAKRAQVFAKAARLVVVAARLGGKDPAMNATLRTAIEKARALNMPKDNIDRAIKRGAGETGEAQLEENLLEAYGPGGTALLIKIITDNKNRTLANVRHILSKHQGKLAEGGGVQWLFDRSTVFTLTLPSGMSQEDFELSVISDGIQETAWEDENTLILYCAPEQSDSVRKNLEQQNITPVSVEGAMRPKTQVAVEKSLQATVQKMLEELDDDDDVQDVYTNATF